MLEGNVGMLLGDLDGRVHVAERRGENQLVARRGELVDHPLGIGALGYAFDERGLDLVAEFLLDR